MNYSEEATYWYLRFNGFFPIMNFVIHRAGEIEYSSDCDALAIRFPYVFEEVGGQPDDWDNELSNHIDMNNIIGLICEVKTGSYNAEEIFQYKKIEYSVGRLGIVPNENIEEISRLLMDKPFIETRDGIIICKLFITVEQKDVRNCIIKNYYSIEEFIKLRIRKYHVEKYRDRMFFNSILLQKMISDIRREYY